MPHPARSISPGSGTESASGGDFHNAFARGKCPPAPTGGKQARCRSTGGDRDPLQRGSPGGSSSFLMSIVPDTSAAEGVACPPSRPEFSRRSFQLSALPATPRWQLPALRRAPPLPERDPPVRLRFTKCAIHVHLPSEAQQSAFGSHASQAQGQTHFKRRDAAAGPARACGLAVDRGPVRGVER